MSHNAEVSGHDAVERAAAFLSDHADERVRVDRLSRIAGVNGRALRRAFQREHGMTPKQFEVRRRLEAARCALRDAASAATVTHVATQFGFFELGRFADIYKRAYGESPSSTLRGRPR